MDENWWKIIIPAIGILTPVLSAGASKLLTKGLATREELDGVGKRIDGIKEEYLRYDQDCKHHNTRLEVLENRANDRDEDYGSLSRNVSDLKQTVTNNHKEIRDLLHKLDKRIYKHDVLRGEREEDDES